MSENNITYSPLDQGVLDQQPDDNMKPKKKLDFKNVAIRLLTGIVYVAIIVASCYCWYHYGLPWIYLAVFSVFTVAMTWEFCTIINGGLQLKVNRRITILAALSLFLATFDTATGGLSQTGWGMYIPFVFLIAWLLISEIYFKDFRKIENWAFACMAICYIALPMALLNFLMFFSGPSVVLTIFIIIWTSDTGAYLLGTLFGKHKLFPSISPNKSWEGSIGGGVFALLLMLALWQWAFPEEMHDGETLLSLMGLVVVVVVFGTWGDLVESRLKRKLGIKDSGHILPGHGGWLDRLDSALLAIPAAFVYIYLIDYFNHI